MKLFCVPIALLKQQGVGVKGMTKGAPVNEEVPPLLEGGGKIEVLLLNNQFVFVIVFGDY